LFGWPLPGAQYCFRRKNRVNPDNSSIYTINHEVGGSIFLRNIDIHLQDYTVSYSRRLLTQTNVIANTLKYKYLIVTSKCCC
jgi:hypothetical protein